MPTPEQVRGWKMNNGAMSPNEFRALCDLALKGLGAIQETCCEQFDSCRRPCTPRGEHIALARALGK